MTATKFTITLATDQPGMLTRADIAATLEAIARVLTHEGMVSVGNTRAAQASPNTGTHGTTGCVVTNAGNVGEWTGAPRHISVGDFVKTAEGLKGRVMSEVQGDGRRVFTLKVAGDNAAIECNSDECVALPKHALESGDVAELTEQAMTALAQGVINICEGLTTIEPNSRVHKAMSYLVNRHVEQKGG